MPLRFTLRQLEYLIAVALRALLDGASGAYRDAVLPGHHAGAGRT